MPDTQKVLDNMGKQIKMARLRRNLSTELVAQDDEFGRRILIGTLYVDGGRGKQIISFEYDDKWLNDL